MSRTTRRIALMVALLSVFALPGITTATHSWGGYHWARTTPSFTLKLGDNVSIAWDPYLRTTSSDWTQSAVLDTTIVAGKAKVTRKFCTATAGQVEVCNAAYGNNGWLGVAQIWVTGLHITQGTVKVNDTYFNTATYGGSAWRNMVMCQEVGHTLGLDHQDTNFGNANLGTCMDYTNDPARNDGAGDNEHPNAHDYEELTRIYNHLDSTTTALQTAPGKNADAAEVGQWGQLVALTNGGRTAVYVLDIGDGQQVVTFVIWAG
jgi:hypothetical protein